jgi:hypothetical protein
MLEKLPTILLLKQQGYSMLKIARALQVSRKRVTRLLKLHAEGRVEGRAEVLAEAPVERRGKKHIAARQSWAGSRRPGRATGVLK